VNIVSDQCEKGNSESIIIGMADTAKEIVEKNDDPLQRKAVQEVFIKSSHQILDKINPLLDKTSKSYIKLLELIK
jgi:hypothetical protein